MGSILTTQNLTTTPHRQLLSEYISVSIRSLDECAQIFLSLCPNEDSSKDPVSPVKQCRYSRFLTFEQFDEVFGLLLADSEPHFSFFHSEFSSESSGNSQSRMVCAYHVFGGIVMFVRTDPHAKVSFLLRLYADAHSEISLNQRRQLIKDILVICKQMMRLSVPKEHDVLKLFERNFSQERESQIISCREVYDIFFTNAQLSGYLHELQSIVEDFARTCDRERFSQLVSIGNNDVMGVAGIRLLNRAPSKTQQSPGQPILWAMRALDFSSFWKQRHLKLACTTSIHDALVAVAGDQWIQPTGPTTIIVVENSTRDNSVEPTCCGILTLDNFQVYLSSLLPVVLESYNSSKSLNTTQQQQDLTKVCQVFRKTSLRELLVQLCSLEGDTYKQPFNVSTNNNVSHFQCISEEECFFNVVMRLACGVSAIAVLGRPGMDTLGQISWLDVLWWIQEDFSLLNGKANYAVEAFPSFFCIPASLESPDATLINALSVMKTNRVTGVLYTPTKQAAHMSINDAVLISATTVCEMIIAGDDATDAEWLARTPIKTLLHDIPRAYEPVCFVSPGDSIAHVIQVMSDHHVRRVYIQQRVDDGILGIIRVTDIFLLLIREQHHTPRIV